MLDIVSIQMLLLMLMLLQLLLLLHPVINSCSRRVQKTTRRTLMQVTLQTT